MANIQAEAELLLGSEHSSQKDSHDGSQVRTSRTSEIVVAVVVPTLNEIDGITGLIPSIKKTLGRYRTEVIVIDGKSSDGTIVRARELGARVLTQQRSGYGDALQLGFRFDESAGGLCLILVTVVAKKRFRRVERPTPYWLLSGLIVG